MIALKILYNTKKGKSSVIAAKIVNTKINSKYLCWELNNVTTSCLSFDKPKINIADNNLGHIK